VVSVGPGRRTNTGEVIPVDVKEGDTVMLPEYGGQPLELSGEK
jgi:chaperonin GroES